MDANIMKRMIVLKNLNSNMIEEAYVVFKNNSNETSVGYNFNTKDYYMVRMNKGKPMLRSKKINGNE